VRGGLLGMGRVGGGGMVVRSGGGWEVCWMGAEQKRSCGLRGEGGKMG